MAANVLPALRPRGIGELLDHTFSLYRRNFFTFVGIVALVQIPLAVLQLVNSYQSNTQLARLTSSAATTTTPDLSYYTGNLVFGVAQFILISGIGTAALVRAITDHWAGRKVGVIEAYARIGPIWTRVVLALLLLGLLIALLSLWLLVPCVGWLTGPGMLIFIGGVITPLATPVLVVENQSPRGAIRRVWDLTRRRFWWVLGYMFVLGLLGYFITIGPGLLILAVSEALITTEFLTLSQTTLVQSVIQVLSTTLVSVIYLPLQLTAITLVYFDLRIRTEGLDLIVQASLNQPPPYAAAEPAGTNEGSPAPASLDLLISQAPAPASESLVTQKELAYFAGLSLGAIILYVILVGAWMLLVFAFMNSR